MESISGNAFDAGKLFAAAHAAPAFPEPSSPRPGPVPAPDPGPTAEPEPPPPSRRGGGFWGLLALLIGAGIGVWLHDSPTLSSDLSGGGGPVSAFRTVPTTTGEMRETLRVGGSIRAEEFAAIRAPQIRSGSRGGGGGGGMTLIAMAAAGVFVRKGDVIAEFDRQTQQQQIDDRQADATQAEAAVKSRQANLMIEIEAKRQDLRTAEGEFQKAELGLRAAEVRSEIEGEILKNARDEAEATYKQLAKELKLLEQAQSAALRQTVIELEQERIDLKRAEDNAGKMLIRAPIDGIVVLETTFQGGGFAQVANGDEVRPGTLFMQIVNPKSMVLEGRVNQADSQKVRMGQLAEVQLDAYPGEVWRGRVRAISTMAGGGSSGRFRASSGNYVREVAVTIDILDQDPRIIPDLSASADVVLELHENVVTAPREALERVGDEFFVWVRSTARNAGSQRRQVEVGALSDTDAVITGGLTGGETLEVRVEAAAALR